MSRPWWTMQPPPVPQQTIMNPSQGHSGGGGGGGSVGTLVVVLAVITILGVLAGVIARICGGRHLAGHGDYDFEGWVENKCSSCIDGSLGGGGPGSRNASGDGAAQAPPKDGGDATSKAAAEDAKSAAGSDEKKEGDGGVKAGEGAS